MDADTVARQGYDAVMRGDIVYVNGALEQDDGDTGALHAGLAGERRSLKRFAKKFRRV